MFKTKSLLTKLSILVVISLILLIRPRTASAWVDVSWPYRKAVTIDHAQVAADLANFPVLISLSGDAGLAAYAQADGDDILFADAGDVKLDHEIEYFDSSTGQLVAWVRVPLLSSTSDTVIYLYYGNPAAANQENPAGVWDANHVVVQHLEEVSGTHYDSTSLNNDGTAYGANQNASGRVDGADAFDGIDDYVDLGNDSSLDILGSMTVEAWIYAETTGSTRRIVSKDQTGVVGKFVFWLDGSANLTFQVADGADQWYRATTGTTISGDTWLHVVGVYDAAVPRVRLYVNGGQVDDDAGPTAMKAHDRHVTIGASHDNAHNWHGIIDEVRISNVARSDAWIATSFRNAADPASFHSVGPQEEYGVNLPPDVSDESPSNGATGVAVNLAELSFSVNDLEGDLVDYSVTTTPDVIGGTQSGSGVASGTTIHVPVTAGPLDHDTTYAWEVTVGDPAGSGGSTVRTFSFETEPPPPAFTWWSISDPHIQTDLPGYLSLQAAILDSLLGGDQGGESFAWDIATVAGDWTGDQQCPDDDDGQDLIAQWIGAGVDRNLFYGIVGNHDACSTNNWWFERWVDPLGEHTTYSGIDNGQRPYPVEGEWDHYRFEVGNVLFLMLGDRNEGPPPFGRECSGGYPAGRVTLETYNWWVNQVESHPNHIIVTISHQGIHETTIYTGYDEGYEEGIHGGHSWADRRASSMIYAIDNWTLDGLDENQTYIGERPYGFAHYLEAHPGAIDIWIHGHTHSGLYPGQTFNGRSDVEARWGVTFVNTGALTKLHAGPEAPFSRLFHFYEGSDEIKMRTYMHSNEWDTVPEGFYDPAEITILAHHVFDSSYLPSLEVQHVQVHPTATDARLAWHTNLPADSLVEYGETPALGQAESLSARTQDHDIVIGGLSADTLHYYQVTSCTEGGDCVSQGLQSFTTAAVTPWTWTDWGYRKAIVIDCSEVMADLVDFPLLVDIVDSDLGEASQPDGDDVFFTDQTDARIPHEIEAYQVNGSAHLVAWVRVPALSSGADTVLYMYYGNPAAASQEDAAGVWDANYVMVHHLEESSGDHLDSTSYENHATTVQVTDQDTTGRFDGADELGGSPDHIRVPNASELQFGEGSFTAEAWIYVQSVPDATGGARIANSRGTGTGGLYRGWQLKIRELHGGWHLSDSAIDDGADNYATYQGEPSYPFGQWVHVAMVYEADQETRFYIDGSLEGVEAVGSYGSIANSLPTALGAAIASSGVEGTHSQFFDGIIDEVRLSNVARSGAWLSAGFNSQRTASSFYRLSAEEEYEPTAVTLASFTAEAGPVQIVLAWETAVELNNLGFNLYRSDTVDGPYVKLNDDLIPSEAPGSMQGASYTWDDRDVVAGATYYYKLESVDIYSRGTQYGPVWATAMPAPAYRIYLPLLSRP